MNDLSEILNLLKKVRRLFADDEKRWIKYTMAIDGRFMSCDPQSKDAKCWCLSGGLRKYGKTTTEGFIKGSLVQDACRELDQVIFKAFPDRIDQLRILSPVPQFNDHSLTRFDDVIYVITTACNNVKQRIRKNV